MERLMETLAPLRQITVTALACASLLVAPLAAAPATATPTAPAAPTAAQAADPIPSEVIAAPGDLAQFGTVSDVALAGSSVLVEVTAPAGPRVYHRPLAGGAWSGTWGGRELVGDLLAAENDVVHLATGGTEVLAWSRGGGGSREVPQGTVLGHGAEWVVFPVDHSPVDRLFTQPVTGGEEVWIGEPSDGYGPIDPALGYALDGDRAFVAHGIDWEPELGTETWSYPAAQGNDAVSSGGEACRSIPGGGTVEVADAFGRFALMACTDGGAALTLDEQKVYAHIPVSAGLHTKDLSLGDGFVLGTSTTNGELLVVPYLGGTAGTLNKTDAFDLDDAGTAVAFVDPAKNVRIASDLRQWSSEPATEIEDSTPPVVDPPVHRYLGTTADGSVEFEVEAFGKDRATPPFRATGVAQHDYRYRLRPAGASQFGDYAPVDGRPYPAGATVCWSATATDVAGNVSQWSAETCATAERPALAPTYQPEWPTAADMKENAGVNTVSPLYSWGTTDQTVTSYQVGHWLARGTSVSLPAAQTLSGDTGSASYVLSEGDQRCLRLRSQDQAGWSAWTGWSCSAAPMGTDTMNGGNSTGPYSHYASPEKGLYSAAQVVGRSARVKVHTGPAYGVVRVYIGTTLLGSFDASSPTSGVKHVVFEGNTRITGNLRIAAAGKYIRVGEIYLTR
jgi:hypothetical protein